MGRGEGTGEREGGGGHGGAVALKYPPRGKSGRERRERLFYPAAKTRKSPPRRRRRRRRKTEKEKGGREGGEPGRGDEKRARRSAEKEGKAFSEVVFASAPCRVASRVASRRAATTHAAPRRATPWPRLDRPHRLGPRRAQAELPRPRVAARFWRVRRVNVCVRARAP